MTVQEFFKEKSILITGGTGYIGKFLIEKLLRCCPEVGTIYLLLREKKGIAPEKRIDLITDVPLFDVLKEQNADAIKKLVPIVGDISQLHLGLSDADRLTLIENVNIVYHAAASIRFDDNLKYSVIVNTRGTREIANLALEMKNLEAFVHISTAYCHTDKNVIEEKMYPALADWKDTINLVENVDNTILDIFTPKYIKPLPNTYTFTKSLAEHVVYDISKGKIPCTIFRPSIVIPPVKEPIPSWIDNFNGPVGLFTAAEKGLVKVPYGSKDCFPDHIPIDHLIKMLLPVTCERIKNKDLNEILVYNGSSGDLFKIKNENLVKISSRLIWEIPYSEILWYPFTFQYIDNFYLYYLVFLVYQMIPAIFFDILFKIFGRKPMIVKLQRKIYIASVTLVYYASNTWHILNDKVMTILNNFQDTDKEFFSNNLYLSDDGINEYFNRSKIAAGKYLFKEEFNKELGLKITFRFWVIDIILHGALIAFGSWLLIMKTDVLNTICNTFNNLYFYWSNL